MYNITFAENLRCDELHTRKKGDYLYVKVWGSYDTGQFFEFPDIIMKKCQSENLYKVVVNACEVLGSDITFIERYYLAEKFAHVFGSKVKTALLCSDSSITTFEEMVANNRGANVRVFSETNCLAEWLGIKLSIDVSDC